MYIISRFSNKRYVDVLSRKKKNLELTHFRVHSLDYTYCAVMECSQQCYQNIFSSSVSPRLVLEWVRWVPGTHRISEHHVFRAATVDFRQARQPYHYRWYLPAAAAFYFAKDSCLTPDLATMDLRFLIPPEIPSFEQFQIPNARPDVL